MNDRADLIGRKAQPPASSAMTGFIEPRSSPEPPAVTSCGSSAMG